jgi:hypothetical protein
MGLADLDHIVPTINMATLSSKTDKQWNDFVVHADRAFGVEGTKSEPTRLQSRFGTSARPMNWQDIQTHRSQNEEAQTCT